MERNRKHLLSKGYHVRTATCLKSARNSLWESPADLVLIDANLPDGSGVDFCRKFRKFSSVPVIFLVDEVTADNVKTLFLNGADDYLIAPYDLDLLSTHIAKRLYTYHEMKQTTIEQYPLSINLATGRAYLDGVHIHLSTRELQLLAHLTLHLGCEFSCEELYHSIWGDVPASTATNIIRVYISGLRHKLLLAEQSFFEIRFTASKCYMLCRVK